MCKLHKLIAGCPPALVLKSGGLGGECAEGLATQSQWEEPWELGNWGVGARVRSERCMKAQIHAPDLTVRP